MLKAKSPSCGMHSFLHTNQAALSLMSSCVPLKDGATVSGATVHFVNNDLDAGPIVLQRQVPVLAGDTAETLAARILEVEHALYPEAIAHALGRR